MEDPALRLHKWVTKESVVYFENIFGAIVGRKAACHCNVFADNHRSECIVG
jgi:hypothetical protein